MEAGIKTGSGQYSNREDYLCISAVERRRELTRQARILWIYSTHPSGKETRARAEKTTWRRLDESSIAFKAPCVVQPDRSGSKRSISGPSPSPPSLSRAKNLLHQEEPSAVSPGRAGKPPGVTTISDARCKLASSFIIFVFFFIFYHLFL